MRLHMYLHMFAIIICMYSSMYLFVCPFIRFPSGCEQIPTYLNIYRKAGRPVGR